MVMNVLVAGCGDVGCALGRVLVGSGAGVWGLRRGAAALPEGVVPIRADLRRRGELAGLPRETEALVFCASADGFDEDAYRALYVDGLRNVIHALRTAGAPLRRVIFTSSTSVYGQSRGEWVDESSSTEPTGFSGRVMLEAERVVAGLGPAGATIRLAGIYGPGRRRLVDMVRQGKAVCREGAPRYTNRIHVEDCAGAIACLLGLDDAAGTWIGSDLDPAEECEVFDWIADRLGVPRPPRGGGDAGVSGRDGSNKRCSSARLRGAGYRFRYPSFRDGYAEMLP